MILSGEFLQPACVYREERAPTKKRDEMPGKANNHNSGMNPRELHEFRVRVPAHMEDTTIIDARCQPALSADV